MEKIQKRIVVKTQVEGTHNWPDCDIEEVSFFKHNNRDIEIINLKHNINDYLYQSFYKDWCRTHCFGDYSCEDIAEYLMKQFDLDLVEVLEDNENGAILIK
jgi:hypothetical protein